jgi:hypothetical protein
VIYRVFAIAAVIATATLTGCGELQPPMARSSTATLPLVKSGDLLYVSEVGHSVHTNVYSYPKAKLFSRLGATGFSLCSDAAGDVFLSGAYGTAEYAHGGATQLAFIGAPIGNAYSCSVDPVTGKLAIVVNSQDASEVTIYLPQSGHQWQLAKSFSYKQPQWACSYDSTGNLFVGGFAGTSKLTLIELRKGASKFQKITLNIEMRPQGSVQWDGTYLAIGDYGNATIHRFEIEGTKGTQVGTVTLSGASNIWQFWIQDDVVIGPQSLISRIGFWKYPQGGTPVKVVRDTLGGTGVTVSVGPD